MLWYNIAMKTVHRWITFLSLSLAGAGALFMLCLRLGGMDAPLIYDEIFSWITADPAHPFSQVWQEVLRADVNIPLFNLLLRGWAYIVPMTPVWMRVFPVIFSLLTPVCAWGLAPKSWSNSQKIVFCSLLGASAALTLHSALLRTYSLAVFLVCVCTLLALQIVQTFIAGQSVAKRIWVGFCGSGLLACYTHYFAAALFFITTLYVLGAAFYYKKQRSWALGVTLLVGLIWLIWAGPVLYSLLGGGNSGVGSGWWIKKEKILAFWEVLDFALGPTSVQLGLLGFVVVGMTSFLSEERPLFTHRPEIGLALMQIILLGITVGIISQKCNLWLGRYFLMLLPAIYLLFTGLLMHLQARWCWAIILLPVFVIWNIGYYLHIYQPYASDPSGLADTFAYVTHKLHRNEVLVAYDRVTYPGPSAQWTLEYFLPKNASLTLTPLTRENAHRMQAPEWVPLVAPLSAFTYVMRFSQEYGFDSGSDLRQFKHTCLVRTQPHTAKG